MKRLAALTAPLLVLLPLVTASAQPPAALEGHSAAVSAAAYSPDGKLIVTGSFDRSLMVWDATTGTGLRTLTGHASQVLSVAIRPDGRQIASGSRDNSIKLWDLYIPTPLQTLAGHSAPLGAVLTALDGAWIATAGDDKLVKMWAPDGKPLRDLAGHEAAIRRLAVNKDNSLLASGDAEGWVRLWNPADGTAAGTLGADATPIVAVAFHPATATLLTAAENGSVKLWQLPVAAPLALPPHAEAVTAVAMSPDGKLLVTGGAEGAVQLLGQDGKPVRALEGQPGPVSAIALHAPTGLVAGASSEGVVQLWNAADGADRGQLVGHAGAVRAVDINAKGDSVATAGADGSVRIWRLPAAPTAVPDHPMPVLAIAVSPDGKLLATGSADKTVKLFNASDKALAKTLEGGAEIYATAFRADGAQLAAVDKLGMLRLWDVAQGTPQGEFSGHVGAATGVVYLPDGKTLVTAGEDGVLRWWNPTPAVRALPQAAAAVNRVVATPDGAQLVVGAEDGKLQVFTTASGAVARALEGHAGPVTSLAAGGAIAVSGNPTGDIRLWTLATGAALPSLAADGPVLDVAVDAAGAQIATAGEDGAIRIWKLPTASKPLPGSALPVQVTAFSNDGSLVASAGAVGGKPTVIVRDAAGAVKATIAAHPAAVTSLAFSADNTKLASGSGDKIARLWNLADVNEPLLQVELDAAVTAVALSADAKQLLAGGANGTLKQFNVADGAEIRALSGHQGAVSAMIVRGTTLISGSADKSVRLWNLSNGAAIRAVDHGAAVSALGASANGQLIATGGADKLVKLWNSANGMPLPVLSGHADAVRSLAVSSDGTRVLSVASDGARLWDASGTLRERLSLGDALQSATFNKDLVVAIDGKHVLHTAAPSLVRLIAGHDGAVNGVAFSVDGKTLASCGADKTVRLWSLADGKQLATLAGATGPQADVTFSKDGRLLAAAGADKTVRIWPVPAQPSAQPVAPGHSLAVDEAVTSIAFSADGSRIVAGLSVPDGAAPAAASQLPTIASFDLPSGLPCQRLSGHADSVADVVFLPDNATVVSASRDKSVKIRALAVGRVVAAAEGKINDLSLSTDGTQLATAGADKKVKLWNTADGSMLHEAATGEATPTSVSLRGDKTQMAIAVSDNRLLLWPVTAQGLGQATTVTVGSPVSRLRHSANGVKLAAAGADKRIRIYDAATGEELESVGTAEPMVGLSFTDEDMSVVAGGGKTAAIQPLSLLRRIEGHEGAVTAVRFLPDGASVVSGGVDKTVRQWTLADGKQTRTFNGSAAAVTSLSISTNGATLLATGAEKIARTWSLAATTPTVEPAAALEHPDVLNGAAIDDAGARMATACADGVIRVWDLASGRQLQRFAEHEGATTSVALSADGTKVLSGGADKTARLAIVAAQRVFVAGEKAADAAFLPDGTIATVGDAMQVKLWDGEGKAVRQLAGAKAELTRLAVRGDGMQVAGADIEGRLLLWNAADGALQQTIETKAPINDLAFSANLARIATAGADKVLRVFDTVEGRLMQEQSAAEPLTTVTFAHGDRELISGAADNSVAVWASASIDPVGELTGHTGPVTSLAYSADGASLASAGADGTARTWNMETKQAVRTFSGHAGPVYAVRLTADGQQLITGGADGTSRLWNVANGAVIRQMATDAAEGATPAALLDVAISPNGQQAAGSASDGVIRVWNLANGQAAQSIPLGLDSAYRLEYLPNGQLVAAGHAGNLTVWNPANAAQVHAAKVPSVAYSAALSPIDKRIAVPCADGKLHFLTLP